MFRICGLAPERIAWESAGNRRFTGGCSARSRLLTRAPMRRRPSGRLSMRVSGNLPMSTTALGVSTWSLARSTRVVPPARYRAWPSAATAAMASSALPARA